MTNKPSSLIYSNLGKWFTAIVLTVPILAILSAICFINSSSQSNQSEPTKIRGEQILVYIDSQNSADIEDIEQMSNDQFTQLEGTAVPNFGFNRSNIWLKFELDPKKFADENLVLEIKNPVLDIVDIYEYHTTELHQIGESGDLLPFTSRPIDHRNYRFPISLTGSETKKFFVKINSGGEQLYAPIIIWNNDQLQSADLNDQLLIGTYFGIILFVLLFNLFIYLILKERSNLYYVQYNVNLLLLQLCLTGYSFQFIWPNSPYLANVTNPFFASIAVFALLKFSQNFLELKNYYAKTSRAFDILGYIIFANAILALFNVQPLLYISIVSVNVLTLVLNFAIIPVTIGVLRKGFKPAKFFLIAFLILVLVVFGFVLTNLGVIQNDFFASYGLLIGSALEVILLSFAIVDRFKSFKDQALENLEALNKIEREQNIILERKVEERTLELYTQQQEILSSIRYAERIQRNILPNEKEVSRMFPESFVYYRPKDIISGDFYWISEEKDSAELSSHLKFAIGDCTGHGVPGAMMSILGINLVREAYERVQDATPSAILEEMDSLLANALNSGEYEYASDGMDIVLCHIDTKWNLLHMAGANTGVVILRNNEIIELKGTRRPLGLLDEKNKKSFETTTFALQRGDLIYTYTDGYVDQFGGPNEKKLKQKGLQEVLLRIAHLEASEQKERIHLFFEEWKGNLEQIDDICVMGIKYY